MRNFVRFTGVLGCVSLFSLAGCGSGSSGISNDSGGATGDAGQSGVIGEAGAASSNGKDGKDGADGKDGTNGTNGTNGADGKDGTNGTNGADGKDGTNGTNGATGADGKDGGNGTNGPNGKNALLKSSHELAGDNCAYAGIRVETGLDANGDGTLGDTEVDATQTQFVCNPEIAWGELPPLPTVSKAYSFALAANDVDGTARLGFMFLDAPYRAALGGALWDNGGSYSGNQVLAIYKLGGDFGRTWTLAEGRVTPQTYQYSELVYSAGQSYYTTLYPSFGGLVSVVKSAQYGTYALTPAFTTHKAHSVGFLNGQMFALIAQKNPAATQPAVGLTLSTFPIAQYGALNNLWTNLATLESEATTVVDPTLLTAGDTLVAAYVRAGKAYVRASKTPQSVSPMVDYPVIGQVDDAAHLSVAWDGTNLYLATVSSAGVLTVQRTPLAAVAAWETVVTHVTGTVTDVTLAGKANSVLLGLRQAGAVRVFLNAADALPSFDAVIPGNFSLLNGASGPTLAVLNLDAAATHTLRSFMR